MTVQVTDKATGPLTNIQKSLGGVAAHGHKEMATFGHSIERVSHQLEHLALPILQAFGLTAGTTMGAFVALNHVMHEFGAEQLKVAFFAKETRLSASGVEDLRVAAKALGQGDPMAALGTFAMQMENIRHQTDEARKLQWWFAQGRRPDLFRDLMDITRIKDTDEKFSRITRFFRSLPDDMRRSIVSMKLFGDAAAYRLFTPEMDKFRRSLPKLIGEETEERAHQYEHIVMGYMQANARLGRSFENLQRSLYIEFMPTYERMLNLMSQGLTAITPAATAVGTTIFKTLSGDIEDVMKAVQLLMPVVTSLWNELDKVAAKVPLLPKIGPNGELIYPQVAPTPEQTAKATRDFLDLMNKKGTAEPQPPDSEPKPPPPPTPLTPEPPVHMPVPGLGRWLPWWTPRQMVPFGWERPTDEGAPPPQGPQPGLPNLPPLIVPPRPPVLRPPPPVETQPESAPQPNVLPRVPPLAVPPRTPLMWSPASFEVPQPPAQVGRDEKFAALFRDRAATERSQFLRASAVSDRMTAPQAQPIKVPSIAMRGALDTEEEASPPARPQLVFARPEQFALERIDRSAAARADAQEMNGHVSMLIDVRGQRGTKVTTTASDLFNEITLRRSAQMVSSPDVPLEEEV